MPSNLIYLIGYIVVIAGLAYGAVLMGIPAQWIGVGVIVMAGLGLVGVAKRGRSKDTFETD